MRTKIQKTDIADGLQVVHPDRPGEVFKLARTADYYNGSSPTRGGYLLSPTTGHPISQLRFNLARLTREGYKLAPVC